MREAELAMAAAPWHSQEEQILLRAGQSCNYCINDGTAGRGPTDAARRILRMFEAPAKNMKTPSEQPNNYANLLVH